MQHETLKYQKAFRNYLRYGMSIERQLKADETSDLFPTTHFVWVTAGDDRVRDSHASREGQVFPYGGALMPGTEAGCRCTAVPYYGRVIDDKPLEPVYPELFFFALLPIGRLYSAWQAYSRVRSASKNWKLGSHKSALKWKNRMEKGDWTPKKITHTIKNGEAYPAPNKPFPSNTATRYKLGDDFVVIDDMTNEVIQVSRPTQGGFRPNMF